MTRGRRAPVGEGITGPASAESGRMPETSILDRTGNGRVVVLARNDEGRVDPTTHEPMTDEPGGTDAQRGGKRIGDPALDDATVTGGSSPRGDELDDDSRLSGEKPARGL